VSNWPKLIAQARNDSITMGGWAEAYEDLSSTVKDLPLLEVLLDAVVEVCAELQVVEVNSTPTSEEVNWSRDRFWILIGGLKLDRGYTVEGLTVTYIPRPAPGSTDVLQQRARFFGYRAKFADYCRVYLPQGLEEEFVAYVQDEQVMRDSLRQVAGQPLSEWKREFFISKNIRNFARANVIGRQTSRLKLEGGWTWPKHMDTSMHLESNRDVSSAYREDLLGNCEPKGVDAIPGFVDLRADKVPHEYFSEVDVDALLNVLLSLKLSDEGDRMLLTAVSRYIAVLAPPVDVVMNSGLSVAGQTGRTADKFRENPFVGRNPSRSEDDRPLLYSGERELRRLDRLTVQFRTVRFLGFDESISWLHFYIPKSADKDVVVEVY
jgi:hypothetical protein